MTRCLFQRGTGNIARALHNWQLADKKKNRKEKRGEKNQRNWNKNARVLPAEQFIRLAMTIFNDGYTFLSTI